MIEIRQIQTGEKITTSVYAWDQNHFNHKTWEILREFDLVQLYEWIDNERWLIRHWMEKAGALDLIKRYPNTYRFEDLPSLNNERLTKNLNSSIPPPIIKQIKQISIRYSKSILKWIILNTWLFIFYVAIAVVASIIIKKYF